tara:strand:- start:233 stop:1447 length:1215 start_codon:yes stop_codon:yes gene_type:complete
MVIYRPHTDLEFPEFILADCRAFGTYVGDDGYCSTTLDYLKKSRPADNSVVAIDDGTIVGTSAWINSSISLPNAALIECGLICFVSVDVNHRRQGILTEMMKHLLLKLDKQPAPLVALWASESNIYGRFGFGVATEEEHISFNRLLVSLLDCNYVANANFLDTAEVVDVAKSLWTYNQCLRPGLPSLSESMWGLYLHKSNVKKGKWSPSFYIKAEDEVGKTGLLAYRTCEGEPNSLMVELIMSSSPSTEQALWKAVLSTDLYENIIVNHVTVDSPFWWMVDNPREITRQKNDALWLRIINVESSLSSRLYKHDGELVILVEDRFLNKSGIYKLSVSNGTGNVSKVKGRPDISMDVRHLSSLFLGGFSFHELWISKKITADDPGKIKLADYIFGVSLKPWCPYEF